VSQADDRGAELNRHRQALLNLGHRRLNGIPSAKVDLSGVVQQTMLDALRAGHRFPDGPEDVQAAWLRRVFANNLADELRRVRAASRDATREEPLDPAPAGSSAGGAGQVPADHSSPSQRAARGEDLARLAAALAALPEDQWRAVELHHLRCQPVAAVADAMGRSKEAVAGLQFRGLRRLRGLLDGEPQVGR
jgi:RNA polymerase sigma-70 factor (subfamily 1)